MRLVKTGLLAAALAVSFGAAASAQSVEIRTRTSGHMLHDDGDVSTTRVIRKRVVREPSTTATITTHRGASYYAPGQVKKRVTTVRSARDYAPGHLMNDDDDTTSTTTVRRRVRTID